MADSFDNNNRTSSRRDSATNAKSSGSVETAVTKLLMSTKQLLQTLTQWSKGTQSSRSVSDAYVRLGYDFKVVVKCFSHAQIDTGDLRDVPSELRKVLEVTLCEPPTEETLNKYLPGIREIVVTLLDNLKVKQAVLKSVRQNSVSSTDTNRSSPDRFSKSPAQRSSLRSLNHTVPRGLESPRQSTTRESISSDITSNSEDVDGSDIDALSQLKKGTSIQRRASKRYSAYHMAKLTNQSATEAVLAGNIASAPLPSLPPSSPNDLVIPNSAPEKIDLRNLTPSRRTTSRTSSPPLSNSINKGAKGPLTVFLQYGDYTKKSQLKSPMNINSLRLLFTQVFGSTLSADNLSSIYIRDENNLIYYELDDLNFSDLKDGSVLRLQSTLKSHDDTNNMIKELRDEFKKSQDLLLSKFTRLLNDQTAPPLNSKDRKGPEKSSGNDMVKISGITKDIASLKNLHKVNESDFRLFVETLTKKIETLKNAVAESSNSQTGYVEESQLQMSRISDSTLSNVDDLQDMIEILRKDVAERGAKPPKKKLELLSTEIKRAFTELDKMERFMINEKPNWKKVWESQLDKVCEEQQFLALQEDLITDLKEDLGKTQETFDLIELCCIEQNRNPAKTKKNPLIPPVHPSELKGAREELLKQVSLLAPDHDVRAEAIERAEKLWEKDKIFKEEDEFKEELGNYVQQSNWKNFVGVEDIDRQRRQKDEENLRANFGVIQ